MTARSSLVQLKTVSASIALPTDGKIHLLLVLNGSFFFVLLLYPLFMLSNSNQLLVSAWHLLQAFSHESAIIWVSIETYCRLSLNFQQQKKGCNLIDGKVSLPQKKKRANLMQLKCTTIMDRKRKGKVHNGHWKYYCQVLTTGMCYPMLLLSCRPSSRVTSKSHNLSTSYFIRFICFHCNYLH